VRSRGWIVVAHLLTLPLALLLAAGLAVVGPGAGAGVDIRMHDTEYVVVHLHTAALLGCWSILAAVAAMRYGYLNWALRIGWGFTALHLGVAMSAAAMLGGFQEATPDADHAVVFVHPVLGFMWLGSALAAFAGTAIGVALSARRGLQARVAGVLT
jgi:hypothetical protein